MRGAIGVLAALGIMGLIHLLGALPGSTAAEIGALALGIMSIALVSSGIIRLVGPAGAFVAFFLILALGTPASGLTSAPELLPIPWAQVGGLVPPGAIGSALRRISYFHGAAVLGPTLVLLGWVSLGTGLNLLADRRTHRTSVSSTTTAGRLSSANIT